MMGKSKSRGRVKPPILTAKSADKHKLYEASVQNPEADIDFMNRVFKKERGRKPIILREDFCGTAKLCTDWVRKRPDNHAIGLDLDSRTLRWANENNVEPLGKAATRVKLLEQDVMSPLSAKVDCVVAFNFSYCVFKQRTDLLDYFQKVRAGLSADGAFFLDIHGGTETHEPLEESTELTGFTYVWDQEPYDAINGVAKRYIHFRFPDGSEIKRAFVYDWRLWTLPELRDVLLDAGFSSVDVYWEGTDKKGEGNGIFRRAKRAEDETSWIAYIVGWV